MPEQDNTGKHPADRHLWEFASLRDVAAVLCVLLLLIIVHFLRAILAPIAVGFALAYVAEPAVRLAKEKLHIRRWVSALILLLVVAGVGVLFLVRFTPLLISQAESLLQRVPDYVAALTDVESGSPTTQGGGSALKSAATQAVHSAISFDNVGPRDISDALVSGTGRLFGFVGTVVSTGAYLFVAGVLILIFFVTFTTGFEKLTGLKQYLPASRRDEIWHLLVQIDGAFSAYVRGQFVVAMFTTIGFCVGFWLASVPYWFLISLVGGVLSLVPYGQMSGWLLAIVMKYVEAETGDATFSWFGVLIAPSIVYAVTQSMESWVITPWVQGESVNLHPVTIIVVLLIGGSVAGVVGLILAIPLTASARMLYREVIRPRLEHWVATH